MTCGDKKCSSGNSYSFQDESKTSLREPLEKTLDVRGDPLQTVRVQRQKGGDDLSSGHQEQSRDYERT